MGRGRAAADVGGGGGAGAGGHGGGGRRRRRRDLVAVRGGARRRARPAGRRQLRERLLRRRARHRPRSRRARSASPPRARRPRTRCATRPALVVRRRGGRRSRAVARRRTRGCCSSASPRSRRRCSTPAGPCRSATSASARCMVLVFFGFVATVGSAYVQVKHVPGAAWWGSLVVGLLACAILLANNVRDVPTDTACGQAHARGAGRRDHHRARCSSRATWARSRRSSSSASPNRGRCSGSSRCRSRWRRCASCAQRRSAVAGRRARRDVEARGRRGRPGERGAVPVLTEHRLRIGDRAVTLLEGPAGWGECSPLRRLSVRSRGVPACRRGGRAPRLPSRRARRGAGERARRRSRLRCRSLARVPGREGQGGHRPATSSWSPRCATRSVRTSRCVSMRTVRGTSTPRST